ncbi:MAG: nucleoid occlusion factor SlmA [Endozoicomonas sp. (ex Botrylloides leachii)]|nr:nucleoid occlusion factor SlmA [Endozoicomonas sp. (ex Botrylloides leachii)]
MDKIKKISRKEHILQALAQMLENSLGERVTTSALAKTVGVSEAALYRHFPSKAKMFEGLIEFIEAAFFSRINIIITDNQSAQIRCEKIILLLLRFCEKNPGLTRLLTGDALAGEAQRLHKRITLIFDRFETHIKQILREAEIKEGLRTCLPTGTAANLILAAAEGRISQYVRSGFKRLPTDLWVDQWKIISASVFRR